MTSMKVSNTGTTGTNTGLTDNAGFGTYVHTPSPSGANTNQNWTHTSSGAGTTSIYRALNGTYQRLRLVPTAGGTRVARSLAQSPAATLFNAVELDFQFLVTQGTGLSYLGDADRNSVGAVFRSGSGNNTNCFVVAAGVFNQNDPKNVFPDAMTLLINNIDSVSQPGSWDGTQIVIQSGFDLSALTITGTTPFRYIVRCTPILNRNDVLGSWSGFQFSISTFIGGSYLAETKYEFQTYADYNVATGDDVLNPSGSGYCGYWAALNNVTGGTNELRVQYDYLTATNVTALTSDAASYTATTSTIAHSYTSIARSFPSSRTKNTALSTLSFAPGTQATETDLAQVGTASVAITVAGSEATETDLAQTGTVAAIVTGGQATETDSAQVGAASVAATVTGSQASETDLANGGTIPAGIFINGNRATETHTAQTGTVAITVAGSQATETDLAQSGDASMSLTGQLSSETDASLAGNPSTILNGSSALELTSARSGDQVVVVVGNYAVESIAAETGNTVVVFAGQLGVSPSTSNSGNVISILPGSRIEEIATTSTGAISLSVAGSSFEQTNLAVAGAVLNLEEIVVMGMATTDVALPLAGSAHLILAVDGSIAFESLTAIVGTLTAAVHGTLAVQSADAKTGSVVASRQVLGQSTSEQNALAEGDLAVSILGTQIASADIAQTGSVLQTFVGSQVIEVNVSINGAVATVALGARIDETSSVNFGAPTVALLLTGREALEIITVLSGSPSTTALGERVTETAELLAGLITAAREIAGNLTLSVSAGHPGSMIVSLLGKSTTSTSIATSAAQILTRLTGSQILTTNQSVAGLPNILLFGEPGYVFLTSNAGTVFSARILSGNRAAQQNQELAGFVANVFDLTNRFLALLSAEPNPAFGIAGMQEVVQPGTLGYARQAATWSDRDEITNEATLNQQIQFGLFGGEVGPVTHYALVSAPTGSNGTVLYYWAAEPIRSFNNGEGVTVPLNALVASVTADAGTAGLVPREEWSVGTLLL